MRVTYGTDALAYAKTIGVGVSTVKSDLVAGIANHCAFFGESLKRVPWNEPCGFDVVLIEQLQHPASAMRASPQATGDVTCRVLATVRAEPTSNGVDVDSVRAEDSLRHVADERLWFVIDDKVWVRIDWIQKVEGWIGLSHHGPIVPEHAVYEVFNMRPSQKWGAYFNHACGGSP